MEKVKSNDDSRDKHKATSGHLSDYLGFELWKWQCFVCWKRVLYDFS